MGGAVSSGSDNNELIDNLMGGGYIRSRGVERVFRVLDRADYMTPNERDQAYKDLAWRSGALHLSAPCIYSEVMEALELRPGLSFLNLGSGTGYLSTLVGLIIGSGGISHGVEIHTGVVEYSNKKLSQFQENSVTLDEFDYCVPKYFTGNALCLAPLQTPYDRVYVGAGVLPKYENYFKQLIKVDGVLVMPLGDTLVQIHRVSETEWTSRQLLNVSFALLRSPTKEESAEPLKLDELTPPPLTILARASIRRSMLGGVCRRHPELKEPAPRRAAHRPRARRICIPLDPDTDEGLNNLHDMDPADGGREMNALLSLVLSMGNNRVAGSLRLPDDARPQEELEVLIDEIDHGSDGEANRLTDTESESDERDARPSAAGAANADLTVDNAQLRIMYGGGSAVPEAVGGEGGESDVAAAPARPDAETPPNAAGRVRVHDELAAAVRPDLTSHDHTKPDDRQDDESDTRPSTSGKSPVRSPPAKPERAGTGGSSSGSGSAPNSGSSGSPNSGSSSGPSSGSSGGPSSGSGNGVAKKRGSGSGGEGGCARRRRRIRVPLSSSRRRANQSANRAKRFPPAVQIYFGNAGVYESSDVVHTFPEEEPEPASEGLRMDEGRSSSEDDTDQPPKDNKRQKLDSGIGEGGAPSSSSSAGASPDKSDAKSDSKTDDSDAGRSSSYTDVSTTDNQESTSSGDGSRRRRRNALRGGYDSGTDSPATRAARLERRHHRDARRVRLSVVMKRGVKELPLPYALKKFVNLGRCFQF